MQIPGKLQRSTDGEVGCRHLRRHLASFVSGLQNRQQRVQMAGTGHHARQQLRHPGFGVTLIALLPAVTRRALQQFIELQTKGSDPRAKVRDIACGIQLATTIAQEPARRAAAQTHQLVHQGQLQLRRHLVIQRLDLPEPVRQMEDVAHDHVGSGDIRRTHARRLVQALNESDAHVVDQIVGNLGSNDFALEAMLQHGIVETLAQLLREGTFHFAGEVVVVRHARIQQRFLQFDLAVGNQNRQLRPGQPLADAGALGQGVIAGQELERAVELPRRLQRIDQPDILGSPLTRAMLRLRKRLGLLVVVLQHQLGHRVGHVEQQLVALLGGHVTGADHLVKQNLDVHFMIRAIDAAGIVNEVGIARSAMQRVLDASQLGHAEVAALAHHLGS